MPSGLHIITSNHMEVLVGGLAEVLAAPADHLRRSPLEPEIILVQSRGMQRWISAQIARLNGICANTDFPFPNAFIDRLCERLDPASGQADAYDRPSLSFRIFHLLPDFLDNPAFTPLKRYLANGPSALKRYQLSRKIADTFDQYAVFRPDWLVAWETGRAEALQLPHDHAWQAMLWHAIVTQGSGPHRSARQKQLVARLSQTDVRLEALPGRISIFGVSHLPPFHLQVLEALARHIPVFFFLLNPCRHYWSDIVSDRQLVRLRPRNPATSDGQAPLYFERGNRLLASLGGQGKQFFDLVLQSQAHHQDEFRENRHDRLLGRIQQDILDLVDRRGAEADPPAPGLQPDGTLRVHSCHSAMREVEVLYDQLLDMLSHTPDLEARDILVMAPDIGAYAPFIHAVFGHPSDGAAPIPYTVADQSVLRASPAIDAFVQILDMADGRMAASLLLGLLSCRPVQMRFGLGETDLPLIHRWVKEAGIRWGWDSEDRRRQGLPAYKENTWQEGLDRLLMGLSMESRAGGLFADILPYDAIQPGESDILGKFIRFAEAVHESVALLRTSDTLPGWQGRLNCLLERFFESDPGTASELGPLWSVVDGLREIGMQVGDAPAIPFEVIRQYIRDSLDQTTQEAGFMAGGVTFCAMLPMRSVPARVICLLGMNHDAFPREKHEPGFNLMAAAPRIGDRSKRNDDRYLFLEALISARDAFYISYVGQNIQDNSIMAPSVVVDELLEYAAEELGISQEALVIQHPLHAFSPAYFNGRDTRLFGYRPENWEAAQALFSLRLPNDFFADALPPADEQRRQCEWRDLVRFWTHPARFLIENRLGVRLETEVEIVEDREAFRLDGLQRYRVNQELLKALSQGASGEEAYRIVRAANLLPHGTPGRIECGQLEEGVQMFLKTLRAILPETVPRSLLIETIAVPFTLSGEIDGLYPQGRIVSRMGKARPKDLVGLFIHHLALHFSPQQGPARVSTLVCDDKIWRLGPLEDPGAIMNSMLQGYWQGLHAPLPFFCQSSHTYAHQRLVNDRSPGEALTFARRTWFGNAFSPGESSDPYLRLCYRDRAPLFEEFEQVALAFFEPLFTVASSVSSSDVGAERL